MVDNQHKKISGYRDLTEEEIALMNEVKDWEKQGKALMGRVSSAIANANTQMVSSEDRAAFEAAEPSRWLAIGRTNIQQGCMAIVRAIARPNT